MIPGAIGNIHNNAATLKPYDPAKALGDVSPPAAKPPKQQNCGIFGMILLAIIAIGVAAAFCWGQQSSARPQRREPRGTATGLTAVLGPVGGAIVGGGIAGAAGSIVSQTFGVLTGIQDSFSWKGVALGALGGAVGGGLAGWGKAATAAADAAKAAGDAVSTLDKVGSFLGGSGIVSTLARGVVSNLTVQGIAVATGLQDEFDWAGVAASAVGSAAGWGVDKLTGATSFDISRSASNIAANAAGGMANAIANAATRSAIEGTSFGDNIMRALPDAIGQTVGNLIAAGVRGPSLKSQIEKILETGNPAGKGIEDILVTGTTSGTAPTVETPEIVVSAISKEKIKYFKDNNPLELKLQIDRLKSEKKDNPEKASKIQPRIDELEKRRNLSIEIQNYAIYILRDKEVLVGGASYTIKGPGKLFDTGREAAIDGIALGFALQDIFGDRHERGGPISKINGKYTYDISTGFTPDKNITINGKFIEAGTPLASFTPPDQGDLIAYFHIHPDYDGGISVGIQKDYNIRFSDGDKDIFKGYAAIDPGLLAYLGGSKGAFLMLQWDSDKKRPFETTLEPAGVFR